MASTSIIVKSVRLSTGIVHAQLLINGNGGNGSGYDGVGGNATHVNNIDQSVPAPAPNFTSTLRRGIA